MNTIRCLTLFFLFSLLLLPLEAKAHHPGHGASGGGSRSLIFRGLKTTPTSRAFLSYEFSDLDNSLGELHTINIGGEWAFHRRLSVLADIPLIYLAHHFQENDFGLGDVSTQFKVLLWDSPRTFSFGAMTFSFPTGNESTGLGRGAVSHQIDYFLGIRLDEWILFTNFAINYGFESEPEPIFTGLLGATSPRFLKRLYSTVSLNSQTFLQSDSFASGSSKLFIEPQINWLIDSKEKWTLTLGGRISVLDLLAPRPGTILTPTSTALLNDIRWSVTLGLNYYFK